MRSYKLVILILLCIYSVALFSQHSAVSEKEKNIHSYGKVSGTLMFPDGTPVADALVYIQSLNIHVMSDENGAYEIKKIPYGRHFLEVKTIEAEPEKVEIHIHKRSTELSIELTESSR